VDQFRQHTARPLRFNLFFLRLAWRNLWRNKRRTAIAGASVFFAVFLAVAMSSMTAGSHEYMIRSAVGFYTGHIQIHGPKYWEKRSLDQSIPLDPALLDSLRSLPHVVHVVPRLETAALISHGNATRVSPIIGVDPAAENEMTGLGKRLIRGSPFRQWHGGALVAEGLARLLGVDVGDSVVVYGQGYQGVTAAAVIPVSGIVHFPIPDQNNAMFYLPLGLAQDLFAAPGRVTAVALMLDSDEEVDRVAVAVTRIAGDNAEVMTWRQMLPELLQAIEVDTGGTVIMLLILYVVIGFGIFGTVMMMTAERTREFGITIALGMRRWRLMAVTMLEALMVSMMGAGAGILVAIPAVLYFFYHPIWLGGDYAKAMLAYGMEPIVPFSIDPMIFVIQGMVVLLMGVVSGLYPLFVVRRLEPVRAMRGGR
jgi:ABC-type lipoprotein release transport system permease subunit